jgi:uncharacterized membrane protein YdjX (TVP38/TMEM64 family)
MLAALHAGRESCGAYAVFGRRAALLAGLCIALAAVASSSTAHDVLLRVLEATQDIIERHMLLGVVTFLVLAAVSAMLAFLSVAVVIPAAVFAWGVPATIALLWLGWILGGVATYALGKYLGRPAVHWLTAEGMLRRLEGHLSARTPIWLIILLQLALPSEVPGYILGLVRYPVTRYLIALAVAELPFTVATVYLGDSFVAGRGGLILIIGALLALGGFCAVYVVRALMTEAK